MKTVWMGRPGGGVCGDACRTCTTTNVLTLAAGVGLGALDAVGRDVRRLARR